jgi:hypothetical protein
MSDLPSERATEIVKGSRRQVYGPPRPIAETAANLWTDWLTQEDGSLGPITPEDVQMMMALHKVAREKHRTQPDNLTDICGYVNIYEETLDGSY